MTGDGTSRPECNGQKTEQMFLGAAVQLWRRYCMASQLNTLSCSATWEQSKKRKSFQKKFFLKLWMISSVIFYYFFFFTLNCRRSHTLRTPSSPPDRRNGSFLFQLMTFTSDEWASLAESMELGGARTSQMRIDWSTEQDAKTCGEQENTGVPDSSFSK